MDDGKENQQDQHTENATGDVLNNEQSNNISRRGFLGKIVALGLGTVAGKVIGTSGGDTDVDMTVESESIKTANEMDNMSVQVEKDNEKEMMERLVNSGLGGLVDYYKSQQELTSVLGVEVPLFPDVMRVMKQVADGDGEAAKKLTEAWREKKDRQELVEMAKEKIGKMEIIGAIEQADYVREIFAGMGEALPVLVIAAQNRIEFSGEGNQGGSCNEEAVFVPTGYLDESDPVNKENFVYTMLHEWGHRLDAYALDEGQIAKLKEVITYEEFENYVSSYSDAVCRTVKDWARMPYAEARRMKYGQMVSADNIGEDKEGRLEWLGKWTVIAEKIQTALEIPNEKINEMIEAVKWDGMTDADALNCKHDFLCHEYMCKLINKEEVNLPNVGLDESLGTSVIREVTHYMVGPIYGSGNPVHYNSDHTWNHEMSSLVSNAAILEAVRLRMLSGDGKLSDREDFVSKVYYGREEEESKLMEYIDYDKEFDPNGEWSDNEEYFKMGILKHDDEMARFSVEQDDATCYFRVHRLPECRSAPDRDYFLVVGKNQVKDHKYVNTLVAVFDLSKRKGSTPDFNNPDSPYGVMLKVGESYGFESIDLIVKTEGNDGEETRHVPSEYWFPRPMGFLNQNIINKENALFIKNKPEGGVEFTRRSAKLVDSFRPVMLPIDAEVEEVGDELSFVDMGEISLAQIDGKWSVYQDVDLFRIIDMSNLYLDEMLVDNPNANGRIPVKLSSFSYNFNSRSNLELIMEIEPGDGLNKFVSEIGKNVTVSGLRRLDNDSNYDGILGIEIRKDLSVKIASLPFKLLSVVKKESTETTMDGVG